MRELAADALPPATSVFFGGGTPSLLEPSMLVRVLRAIDVADGAEVTVECNPENVSASLLDAYVNGGVTRVSFGVQSMVPSVLASLGREHDVAAVDRALSLVRDVGFVSWNVDVIYGAAGESIDEWRRTLDAVLAFEPPHMSAYALTVEHGTPLARDRARHPDDDDQAEKYAIADDGFAAAGLEWYEVSNWSIAGHECRHNSLYWSGGAYRGVGCAAHSFDGWARRWWNVRTPERYIAGAPDDLVAGSESLAADARRREAATLLLRTRRGVETCAFENGALGELSGLVDVVGDRVVLTRAGRLLANEVALRLR